MKKLFFATFFIVGLASCACSTYSFLHSPQSYRLLKLDKKFGEQSIEAPVFPPFIRIQMNRATCSAFVIDANYAATAAHCLNEEGFLYSGDIKVFSADKDTGIVAKAVGYVDRSDFGLIKGNFSAFQPANAEFHTLAMFDGSYATCGYPYGEVHFVCNGFIPRGNAGFAVQGTGFVVPGMSGGPVIDLVTNKVVGIIFASTDGAVLIHPLQGFLGAFNLE